MCPQFCLASLSRDYSSGPSPLSSGSEVSWEELGLWVQTLTLLHAHWHCSPVKEPEERGPEGCARADKRMLWSPLHVCLEHSTGSCCYYWALFSRGGGGREQEEVAPPPTQHSAGLRP